MNRRIFVILAAIIFLFLMFWGLARIGKCPFPDELNTRETAAVAGDSRYDAGEVYELPKKA
jgi:hypothetical protein